MFSDTVFQGSSSFRPIISSRLKFPHHHHSDFKHPVISSRHKWQQGWNCPVRQRWNMMDLFLFSLSIACCYLWDKLCTNLQVILNHYLWREGWHCRMGSCQRLWKPTRIISEVGVTINKLKTWYCFNLQSKRLKYDAPKMQNRLLQEVPSIPDNHFQSFQLRNLKKYMKSNDDTATPSSPSSYTTTLSPPSPT